MSRGIETAPWVVSWRRAMYRLCDCAIHTQWHMRLRFYRAALGPLFEYIVQCSIAFTFWSSRLGTKAIHRASAIAFSMYNAVWTAPNAKYVFLLNLVFLF